MAEALKTTMRDFDVTTVGRSLTQLARTSRGVRPPETPLPRPGTPRPDRHDDEQAEGQRRRRMPSRERRI